MQEIYRDSIKDANKTLKDFITDYEKIIDALRTSKTMLLRELKLGIGATKGVYILRQVGLIKDVKNIMKKRKKKE